MFCYYNKRELQVLRQQKNLIIMQHYNVIKDIIIKKNCAQIILCNNVDYETYNNIDYLIYNFISPFCVVDNIV